ncbi:hypothetical protein [Nostoc sp. CHAB 5836]|uniref:hypothetical protein n=1 Tax=Nostoc sp. CHAB 5836 TaxID=2780404 RepID=UPI001E569BE4|nr:hypothetical protein [Nostoc sp. CHAB 5836]
MIYIGWEHPKCAKTLIALTPNPMFGIRVTKIMSPLCQDGGEGKDLSLHWDAPNRMRSHN